ncbi:hypothetical protein KBC03_03810 [Patescibacteria group bacterium]|nr:hypothetical protein [Patescibacteria group bacterium]
MPSEAQDTLIVFEKLFEKYAKAGIIKRNPALLEDVFDDRRMVDYYLNAKEEEVMTAANNYKQEQAMIKKQIAAGRFTSNDMDDNDPFSFLRAA